MMTDDDVFVVVVDRKIKHARNMPKINVLNHCTEKKLSEKSRKKRSNINFWIVLVCCCLRVFF